MRSGPLSPPIPAMLVALSLASSALATDLPPPGTVVWERSAGIGFGFREVHRSTVTPPGSFEGIGHFTYVYYRGDLLCQCGRQEIVISPDGIYALFVDVADERLILFHSATGVRRTISQEYLGYPSRAVWGKQEVVVTLVRHKDGTEHSSTLHVPL